MLEKKTLALDKNFPILLFPLKIETKYYTKNESGSTQYFLRIRIFPDYVSVEQHDKIISYDEYKNTSDYLKIPKFNHEQKKGKSYCIGGDDHKKIPRL